MATKQIRRDIYSVKVLGEGLDDWCHERMFKSLEEAKKYASDRRDNTRLGFIVQTEIVHPASWVVDAYLAFGNQIEE